jgi:TPR repeat protein
MSNENYPEPMDVDKIYDIVNDINNEKIDYKKISQTLSFNFGSYLMKEVDMNKHEIMATAFNCFSISAKLGSIEGIYKVGYCYHQGHGVEKNNGKALKYYQEAKNNNFKHEEFLNHLIKICEQDIEEEKKIFNEYLKKVENNYADGDIFNNIGNCYENGIGIEKDEDKALFFYQKAVEMKHHYGTYNYGRLCFKKK